MLDPLGKALADSLDASIALIKTKAISDVDPVGAMEDKAERLDVALRSAHTDVVNILARIADGARVDHVIRWLADLAADLAKQMEAPGTEPE